MKRSEFLVRPKVIYALRDPRDGVIRYVGQTFTPETRFRAHVMDAMRLAARGAPLSRMALWIKELWEQELCPDYLILETTTEALAEAREQAWIDCYAPGLLNPNVAPGAYKGQHLIQASAGSSEQLRKLRDR